MRPACKTATFQKNDTLIHSSNRSKIMHKSSFTKTFRQSLIKVQNITCKLKHSQSVQQSIHKSIRTSIHRKHVLKHPLDCSYQRGSKICPKQYTSKTSKTHNERKESNSKCGKGPTVVPAKPSHNLQFWRICWPWRTLPRFELAMFPYVWLYSVWLRKALLCYFLLCLGVLC